MFNLDDRVHKHSTYQDWRDGSRERMEAGEYFAPAAFPTALTLNLTSIRTDLPALLDTGLKPGPLGSVIIFDRGPSGAEAVEILASSYLTG